MIAIKIVFFGFTFVSLAFLLAVLYFISTPFKAVTSTDNIFGFSAPEAIPADLPLLQRYVARDGEKLAYRSYESNAENVLIFVHGSSYHGAAYHDLAKSVSNAGAAKVFLPNLRGHYMSGSVRGDVEYVGQLEDDLADLIAHIRQQGNNGQIYIGGHSSGGGLVIRFAGGEHGKLASGYLLLAPIIPLAPGIKGGDSGGWANLNERRLYALLALNAVGIAGLNGLDIIRFNKPELFWDGTETLSYSYRLNTSYHPRYDYKADIEAMGSNYLVIVGENDEANDATRLTAIFREVTPDSTLTILPGVNHFGVFTDALSHSTITDWIR